MPVDTPAPRATYRLQLTPDFGFDDATRLFDYLLDLGVSHVYLSPVLQAAPGSRHGYDVVDPASIDRDRGGADAFARMLEQAESRGLQVMLDIVPNHMSTDVPANRYWWDVLRRGRSSPFATWFDVDWNPPDPQLKDKVLLPVLPRPLDQVLDDAELSVVVAGGEPALELPGMRLPLSPESASAGPDRSIEELLPVQHYALEYWRTGLSRLNWRRFFDISGLIGIRVEDPSVFEATHALTVEQVRKKAVAGLRVDHPDGLRDPSGYFRRLRATAPEAWVVAEKILGPKEDLPPDWPVDGTTGYDFLNLALGLFVDPDGELTLSALARELGDPPDPFDRMVRDAKHQVLLELFPAELERLSRLAQRATRAPAGVCREALVSLLTALPVYRTYRREDRPASATDRGVLEAALRSAGIQDSEAMRLIVRCLEEGTGPANNELEVRFQQLSSALAAKGVEDTAFYRHRRLLCLNEVGGDPGRFGVRPGEFHDFCRRRAERWPLTLNASSTHDTKRSEDVRCRLAVLSEVPGAWAAAVRRWRARHRRHAPDSGMLYYLYQTLTGAWPVTPERVTEHLLKAARECKERTSWYEPDAGYESGLLASAEQILAEPAFVSELEELLRTLEPAGRSNSLALTLLKCTAPGVPDLYQGSELWYRTLTDPDNRRPVDYARRRRLLDEVASGGMQAALAQDEVGATKLWLLHRALAVRRERSDAFASGSDYLALEASGPHAHRVLSFCRGGDVVTVVPRLTLGLEEGWGVTRLHLPTGSWQNALTGEPVRTTRLDELLGRFPVGLLVRAP